MRSTTVALIVVVALAIALCLFSYVSVRNTISALDDMRVRALDAAAQGNLSTAKELLVQMATEIQRARPLMEVLSSHDVLHEASRQLVDAQICLEFGEMIEFHRAMAQMGQIFEHMQGLEELSLANLY